MAKQLNELIIVDVEATAWEPKDTRPPHETSEIIEIGVTRLTYNAEVWTADETHSLVVRPRRSTVSTFCAELTGWTQDRLEREGTSYEAAIACLRKLYPHPDERPWASWGDYDRTMFATCAVLHEELLSEAERATLARRRAGHTGQNAGDYKHPLYPFGRTHLNLKTLFALAHKLPKEVSVGEALTLMGLTFQGQPHRGVDDAVNIARIAQGLLWRLQVSP